MIFYIFIENKLNNILSENCGLFPTVNDVENWTVLKWRTLISCVVLSHLCENQRQSSITSIDLVFKIFIKTVLTLKSNKLIWILVTGHAPMAYNKHGRHLDLINWAITSTDPLLLRDELYFESATLYPFLTQFHLISLLLLPSVTCFGW